MAKGYIMTPSTQQSKAIKMNKYNTEKLTALYAALDYMECADLDTGQIELAIELLEADIAAARLSK